MIDFFIIFIKSMLSGYIINYSKERVEYMISTYKLAIRKYFIDICIWFLVLLSVLDYIWYYKIYILVLLVLIKYIYYPLKVYYYNMSYNNLYEKINIIEDHFKKDDLVVMNDVIDDHFKKDDLVAMNDVIEENKSVVCATDKSLECLGVRVIENYFNKKCEDFIIRNDVIVKKLKTVNINYNYFMEGKVEDFIIEDDVIVKNLGTTNINYNYFK